MGPSRAIAVRAALIAAALAAPFIFPLYVTTLLAILGAVGSPFVPLAVGLLVDALYWSPGDGVPLASIVGGLASIVAFFVHRYIKTSIMY